MDRLSLLGSVLSTLVLIGPVRVVAQQPPQSADPIDLFAKMYPTFTHPRCINCHGVVKSFPGNIRSVTETHHNDPQGDSQIAAECGDCHDTPKILETAWQFTAPDQMSWVGKNLEQLCALQSAEVRNFNGAARSASVAASGSYMNHLTTDPLITQAFDGRAGGARDPKPPAPPPMTRGEFLAAAQAWVDAGAGCGRLTGTISQVESFSTAYSFPMAGHESATVGVVETALREVQIFRQSDGKVYATVSLEGENTNTMVDKGPCPTTMTDLTSWHGTTQSPMDVALTTDRKPDGSYTITFTLPEETTEQIESVKVSSCTSVPASPPAPPVVNTWPRWQFVIRCPAPGPPAAQAGGGDFVRCNPNVPGQPPALSGEMVRTIRDQSDGAEPQSWLNVSPVGISRGDTGKPIPFTVRTVWNLADK